MGYAIAENAKTIACIQEQYNSSEAPWYLGFSGGKDSSATLKLAFLALRGISTSKAAKQLTVLYCDTGVEIPIFRSLVVSTLESIQREAFAHGVPLGVQIAEPPVNDRYFAKVIGKGYPPPTNKFRWCTDRLRIRPIKKILDASTSTSHVVLLGIRRGESLERDRTITRHSTDDVYFYRQTGNTNTLIFAPIINYSTEDVWATIAYNTIPESIDAIKLMALYRQAAGECPIIRDPRGTPCGKGRFGCWTCTVVRRDKSVSSLIEEGYHQLQPLLSFRDWLAEIRDLPRYRAKKRRNGAEGPGPFLVSARQEILSRLREVEAASGYALITKEELAFVAACWAEDSNIR